MRANTSTPSWGPSRPSAPPSPAFLSLHSTRVAYFLQCPFIGPVKANQLALSGCRTWADVLAQSGVRGSGVKLDCRQQREAEGEGRMEEWVERKRRQGYLE